MERTLDAAVLAFIAKNPGCTVEEIAKALSAEFMDVTRVLARHRADCRATMEVQA